MMIELPNHDVVRLTDGEAAAWEVLADKPEGLPGCAFATTKYTRKGWGGGQ